MGRGTWCRQKKPWPSPTTYFTDPRTHDSSLQVIGMRMPRNGKLLAMICRQDVPSRDLNSCKDFSLSARACFLI